MLLIESVVYYMYVNVVGELAAPVMVELVILEILFQDSTVTTGTTVMKQAKFSIGQRIHHRMFGYRGVIVDVDPEFSGTDEWYELVAKSQPPKDEPWYHVLVHEASNETYVAERNLSTDQSDDPVEHPLLREFFVDYEQGVYTTGRQPN